MKNWFDIAVPHEDIRKGDFDEAVFAADLGDVVAGRAAADYNDPYTFYKKTYLTYGLENLLQQVHKKLTSGQGPSVLELQTPFGGGKTHALVLVYHYLENGRQIQNLLPDEASLVDAAVSAIVGTQLNPSEGTRSDGLTRQTMWGEMAFQLGGRDAYRAIEPNDANRISPGKGDLRTLLKAYQPFVLLFDEILEYVVRARGVMVGDSSLAAQTLAFFQELTEAVASLDRGLMIVTLPSSELEDFGDAEQRNLAQLERVFQRIETIVTPVQGEEVYSIIRRRLFEPIRDEAAVREIADAYIQTYQHHKDELPPKARDIDYRRKLELAYPFHPDVIDILYEKWGTFSTFQRTRGVLRLLANVVEDLYQREQNLDLILPGDVSLGRPEVRQEFISHIGPEYESIIGSDVAGVEAKAQNLDRANRDWKHLAERISTAVFLHSFTADDSERGISLPYIKLAVIRPDTISPLVTEVLQKLLNEELWYLHPRGERYYFSNIPNLIRMIRDKKELVSHHVRAELERRIKRELGTRFRCYLGPQSSDALPDNRELKLAVLDPESMPSLPALAGWIDRRGDSFRVYKNTLFFAIPDAGRHGRIEDEIRECLALREIKEEIKRDERPGMREKKAEVDRRIQDLEEQLPLRVRGLYRTAAVPMVGGDPSTGSGQALERIDLGQPTVGRENLDSWYWKELTEESRQKIMTRPPSARMLTAKFLSNSDAVSLAVLLEQFYKDPGLQVPASPSVLAEAIAQAVQARTLGIGSGTADGIVPTSVKFDEPIQPSSIYFHEDVFLMICPSTHHRG
ncbi:MAG: ATP-binding protein [Anaerolineae bacterium]